MQTKISRQFSFCASHRLYSCVDPSHPCHSIHGHNYEGEVIIKTHPHKPFSIQGMLIDFRELKIIVAPIENAFDHATIFHRSDPLSDIFRDHHQKVIVLEEGDTTVENMTFIWASKISLGFCERLDFSGALPIYSVEVKMNETSNCWGSSEIILDFVTREEFLDRKHSLNREYYS